MTYGCGAYTCVSCYPYTYRCECGKAYPDPIPNGQKIPECIECGHLSEVMP
jgi:hypothetical protein